MQRPFHQHAQNASFLMPCPVARKVCSLMSVSDYVHGYSPQEQERLLAQAGSLTELLHWDTRYPPGSRVLEAACGVGAQTVTLACNSPQAHFTSIDIDPASLDKARQRVQAAGCENVTFEQADIYALPYPPDHFDHIFVCFVLEHLPAPEAALEELGVVLKPGGGVTVIEGDHGSAYFHPDSAAARETIDALVTVQAQMGGNAPIGRQLYPLLVGTGYADVQVSPRVVYADASRPGLVESFTRRTFTAMVELVREEALGRGLMDPARWAQGIADLHRTAEDDGVFLYTFFKGVGMRPVVER